MSSILTNTSAMNAVASLMATQAALAKTQGQISSGLAVASAADNASYWSIGTSMRSNIGALGSVADSINLGSSIVSVAYAAISSSISVLNQMKDLVISSQTAGVDTQTIDTQLSQLQDQLQSISNSASFNGINLLVQTDPNTWSMQWTSSPAENVVTSFENDNGADTVGFTNLQLDHALYGSGDASDGTQNIGIMQYNNYETSDPNFSWFENNGLSGSGWQISNMQTSELGISDPANPQEWPQSLSVMHSAEIAQIEGTLTYLTSAASTLGSIQSNLAAQGTFTQSLINSMTSGVGSLVDADMTQASTKLNALQTQQQLGIQSLSIANNNSQLILKLFGN